MIESVADTKTKILNLAEEHIQSGGYHAFSYQHISTVLGIKNAAIHYHFPSKEDLGVEVIRRERQRFKKWKELPEVKNGTHWQQLHQFIQIFDNNLMRGRICMMGAIGSVYSSLPESMQKEAMKFSSEIHQWLTKLLKQGKDAHVFKFKGKARDKALVIASSLSGALQLARLQGNDAYHRMAEQLLKDLQS